MHSNNGAKQHSEQQQQPSEHGSADRQRSRYATRAPATIGLPRIIGPFLPEQRQRPRTRSRTAAANGQRRGTANAVARAPVPQFPTAAHLLGSFGVATAQDVHHAKEKEQYVPTILCYYDIILCIILCKLNGSPVCSLGQLK